MSDYALLKPDAGDGSPTSHLSAAARSRQSIRLPPSTQPSGPLSNVSPVPQTPYHAQAPLLEPQDDNDGTLPPVFAARACGFAARPYGAITPPPASRLPRKTPSPKIPKPFRPFILRPATLICVLVLTLGLIGLIEGASRGLPAGSSSAPLGRRDSGQVMGAVSVLVRRLWDDRFGNDPAGMPESAYLQPVTTAVLPDLPVTALRAHVSSYLDPYSTIAQAVSSNSNPVTTALPTPTPYPGVYSTATTFSGTAAPAESVNPTSTATTESPNPTSLPATEISRWPMYKYFIGSYLPVLLSIFYRLLFTSIHSTTLLLEPFYVLSQPFGALAKDSLCIYYLSSSVTPDIVLGLLKGHWVVLWTSVVNGVVGLVAPVASELLFVDAKSCMRGGKGDEDKRCFPRLGISQWSVRILEGLLIFIAVMLLVLIYLHKRRPRCVVSGDPASIATIASLLHHEEVLEDFRRVGMGGEATEDELKRWLGERRYKLTYYMTSEGWRYGLVPIRDEDDTLAGSYYKGEKDPPVQTQRLARKARYDRSTLIVIRDAIFGLVLVGVLGLVVAYYRENRDTPFNRFMNSETFGPRFIMTLVGSLVDSHWKRIAREVRTVDPYKRMARGNAKPNNSILVPFTSTPITALFSSLFRKQFFLAFISFITLLSEILVITLSGIPFNSSQLWTAYVVSNHLSIIILSLMILTLPALFFWRRRLELPRMPSTVGATMSYLCASYILEDFDGIKEEERGRKKMMGAMGTRYLYGRLKGVDRVTRWAVDKELDQGKV